MLAVELLKGLLSIGFAWRSARSGTLSQDHKQSSSPKHASLYALQNSTATTLIRQVFSPDCWKLSIPAILYVSRFGWWYFRAATPQGLAPRNVGFLPSLPSTAPDNNPRFLQPRTRPTAFYRQQLHVQVIQNNVST